MRRVGLILCLLGIWGCQTASQEGIQEGDPNNPFKNLNAKYVGDAACVSCHEALSQTYKEHGMANSMYPLTPANAIEDFNAAPVFHEATGFYYRAFREGDGFYQEEYRMEAGQKTHALVRPIKFVVGSGTAARTYLTEAQNNWYELPLTWYTQVKKWAFSPGYKENNGRFGRAIPDRCMSCHNAYPKSVAHVEGKYEQMPSGIGCERCHGPGALHVEERTATPDFKGKDYTIVNPKHLSLDRRLDVCQQCHLHGPVSMLREGKEAQGFRPSMALASHVTVFKKANAEANGQIAVISHADRMKASACFKATANTQKPMDCVTCHNPHEGFRSKGAAYFNNTCLSCHPANALPAQVSAAEKANHQASANCISCHMPKTEAADAPHSSFTDHLVRVVKNDKVAYNEKSEAQEVVLKPYLEDKTPEAPVYEGMAYIVFGRNQNNTGAIQKGIAQLKTTLPKHPNMSEAQFVLGYALVEMGSIEEGITWIEKAVAAKGGVPERLNALAQAYESAGRGADKIEPLYRKALEIQPLAAKIRTNYGRFLETQNRTAEAMEAYKTALKDEAWQGEANYNIGSLYLKQGQKTEAEQYLKAAVSLNPDHPKALGNLGVLLAQQGRANEAVQYFTRALRIDGNNVEVLGNLATYYIQKNQLPQALPLLQKATQLTPTNGTLLGTLAAVYYNVGKKGEAKQTAQQALQYEPNNAMARQVLAAP